MIFYWVNIDEGDIAIENEIELTSKIPPFSDIRLGQELSLNDDIARVTEKNTCKRVGAEGELPFVIRPDETFEYADLIGKGNDNYTLEYGSDGIDCFKGKWIDPFEVKAA